MQSVTSSVDSDIFKRLTTLEAKLQDYTARLESGLDSYDKDLMGKLQKLEATVNELPKSDAQVSLVAGGAQRLALEAKAAVRRQAEDLPKQLAAFKSDYDNKWDGVLKDIFAGYDESGVSVQMLSTEVNSQFEQVQQSITALREQSRQGNPPER